MKTRVTVKELNRMYPVILSLGSHGLLDHALQLAYDEAKFYHAGGLGWNYDVFEINTNTCIATGYRVSNTLKTINKNYCGFEFCKSFAEKAEEIRKSTGIGYEAHKEMQKKLRSLINDFVQTALNQ